MSEQADQISSPVIDFWTNVRTPAAGEAWRVTSQLRGVAGHFRAEAALTPRDVSDVLVELDAEGVDLAVVSGLAGEDPRYPTANYAIDEVLVWCAAHPTRLRAALTIDGLGSVSAVCRVIERAADHPGLGVVRVVPILVEEPISSPRLYPVYERCEALGVPVSVNVGVPGPKMRAKYQDPMLLDDVLIDFPELVVVAAHMGHPWESLLVRLMRKYEHLHLATSAWLADYLDPAVIRFMDSSAGRDRLIFASDAPLLPLGRALGAARALPLSPEAMANFLGGNAARVLRLAGVSSGATQRARSAHVASTMGSGGATRAEALR